MEQTAPIHKTMRPAAVAGQFFPGVTNELVQSVDQFLKNAITADSSADQRVPKALVVPHAGYRYSGAIAASAYIKLLAKSKQISRVVLIGPAHKVRIQGMGFTSADYFETPLGRIPVDIQTVRQCVNQFRFATVNNKAHQHEHSLETQLPFLQRVVGKFSLVPVVVGAADPMQIAECLSFLWGGDETLIVISTDLSHFKSYADANEIDAITSRAITSLNPAPITYEHACGQVGLRGLLTVARSRKLEVQQLDVRNSGDTADRKDQVVGYGSFAFHAPVNRFDAEQRAGLGRIARMSIAQGFETGNPLEVEGDNELLRQPGSTFVTLNTANGRLRGCIGSLTSQQPLAQNVSYNAFKSAFNDARFKPLTVAEQNQIKIEISVLSPWQQIIGESEDEIVRQIHPFVDGLIFIEGDRRGTFLPSVWKSIADPNQFFCQLKRKAGFAEDYWSERVKIYRYYSETWSV